ESGGEAQGDRQGTLHEQCAERFSGTDRRHACVERQSEHQQAFRRSVFLSQGAFRWRIAGRSPAAPDGRLKMPRACGLLGLLLVTLTAYPQLGAAREALRVCADPNNMPFSHKDETGIENKLAKLWAEKLGVPLEYTWFPQRLGFLRNTINAPAGDRAGYKCDV